MFRLNLLDLQKQPAICLWIVSRPSYTKYFVSGAGSETTPVIVHPDGGVFAKSENGFMNISLTTDQMEVTVIGYMGETLYKTVIQHN